MWHRSWLLLLLCPLAGGCQSTEITPGTGGSNGTSGSMQSQYGGGGQGGSHQDPFEGRVDSVVAWAHQGTAGLGGVLPSFVLGMRDGSVLVGAGFSGTVELGGLAITTDATSYQHTLLTRVAPDGKVSFLRHVADGLGFILAATELPDGRVAIAGAINHEAVLAPGTADAVDLAGTEPGAAVFIVDASGNVSGGARIADGLVEVSAISHRPAGGLFVGGNTADAVFSNGSVVGSNGFFPGHGFVLTLDDAFAVGALTEVRGDAGSTFGQLVPHGNDVLALGDFGGYPLGAKAIFGEGTPKEVTLAGVTSDDDPSFDIFFARLDESLSPVFARRIADYSNGPRTQQSWMRALDDTSFTFLLPGARGIEEVDGQFATLGPLDVGPVSLCATFDANGGFVRGVAAAQDLVRWPNESKWLGLSSFYSGLAVTLGEGESAVPLIAAADDADTVASSLALGHWTDTGGLVRVGLLTLRVPKSHYPLALQGSVPQPDGSFLVVLNGSPALTLTPDQGSPITLAKSEGYERLVFARVGLAPKSSM